MTFTIGNPAGNTVSLSGVNFSDGFPAGLRIVAGAATTCSGGSATGAVNATSLSLMGGTLAAGATCTVTAGVSSPSNGSYTNTSGAVMATNSNAGSTATATLMVAVTPTRVVYTSVPPTPITAGGNAGTVSVALEDAAGNVNTADSSSKVNVTVTGPSGYSQTYSNLAVTNGVASLNLSSVPLMVAGLYTYTANSGTLTAGVAVETVNPGSFVTLSGSGPATFYAPGQTGSATVRAVDSYGNAVTGFTGTVTLSANDPLAVLPGAYTYGASDAGSHTFTYSFGTAGTGRTLTIATSGSTITQASITVEDAIVFINPNGSLSRLTNAGVATSPAAGYTGGGAPTMGLAADAKGNLLSVNATGNVLAEFSKAGTALSGGGYTGGGLSAPTAVAIDGVGMVWVANGNGAVSEFTNVGAAVSPAAGYAGTGTGSQGIAIDNSGDVWIANGTSGTVTEVLGGAAPAVPLVVGIVSATTGARP